MADPPKPSEISRREFEVVRRGYDQQDVRGFLHEVSGLVDRLQRTEAELTERATRAEARLKAAEHPDEGAMLELLGEETTRVLTSAREAATDIRAKAEEAAERIIAEATAQAAQTRSGAVAEADKRLAEARAEGDKLLAAARGELERRSTEAEEAAERIRSEGAAQAQALRDEAHQFLEHAKEEAASLVEAAKEEGRQLVADAQALRERVLRDLSARRKKARLQIEQLHAGRERLLQAYDVVRTTVQEATEELQASVTDARLAAAAAARRIELEAEPTVEELDRELSTARLVDLPVAEPPPLAKVPEGRRAREAARSVPAPPPEPPSTPPPAAPAAAPSLPAAGSAASGAPEAGAFEPIEVEPARPKRTPPPSPPPEDVAPSAPPAEEDVTDTAAAPPAAPGEDVAATDAPPPGPPAEDAAPPADVAEDVTAAEEAPTPPPAPKAPAAEAIFARLHAEVEAPAVGDEPPAQTATDEAEGEEAKEGATPANPDAAAFEERAALTEPLERDLARRLKRALADEQNEVLDRLRRTKPAGVDDLLPPADDHVQRWAELGSAPLQASAAAGAGWSGGRPGRSTDLAEDLARSLVLPLRERVERSFAASDGNLDDVADRVRALYREWKNQKLPDLAIHYVAAAYARGVLDGLPAGRQVRWVVDPLETACPDCDDNVLAGAVDKGAEFPTGSACAPAHPGCRCLVLLADG